MLKGFPSSNRISPGELASRDVAIVVPNQTYNKAALVGFTSKGPVNTPTTIRDSRQLYTMFGHPNPDQGDPHMLYAAEQHLLVGTEVIICRVADPSITRVASVPVPAVTNLVKVHSTVKGPYKFNKNQFFRWRLDGVLAPKTLVILATEEGLSAAQLAEELNDQLTKKDGIQFYAHEENYIGVQTTTPEKHELELISVQDAMYGPWSVTGLGVEMTPAEKIGHAPEDGIYDFAYCENLTMDVVVSGSNNITVDGIVQTVRFRGLEGRKNTIDDIVDYVNNIELPLLPGGWRAFAAGNALGLRTKHTGRDASIFVKPSRAVIGIFGLDTIIAHGKSPKSAIFFGSINQDEDVSLRIHADSPGVEGNVTRVVIANEPNSDTFTLNVYNGGVLVESWGQLTKNKKSRFYVESFVNLVSEWIKVEDNPMNPAPPKCGVYLLGDERVAGAVKGCDGIPSDRETQDLLLAGCKEEKTGLFSVANPAEHDLDLIAVPGRCSKVILDALVEVCEIRRDCLAIIDPPMELSATETLEWIKPYQSDCAALFWPWVQIRDSHNRRNVWVPPSGSVMATIARSDAVSAPWFPPTGNTRGIVPGVIDVFTCPNIEENRLLSNSNVLNTVVHNPACDTFTLNNQKTLGGGEINIKRMLFCVEKTIRSAIDKLLSDDLSETDFRDKFEQVCDYVLGQVKNGRGIYRYTIQAEEVNTPEDMKELRARIGVQPREASGNYYINFEYQRVGDKAKKLIHSNL